VCALCFLGTNSFAQYANFTRPHSPDATKGWTVVIPWSHGAYGTRDEQERVMLFFNSFFFGFGVIALGEAIKIYKLGEYPKRLPSTN
jgi:hypothetical protein